MGHVGVGKNIASNHQPIQPPQFTWRGSEQRAAVVDHPPPAVQRRGQREEWNSVLVREGEEPRALWELSPPQEVVAGSQAVMQGREVHRRVVGGQRRGFQQGRPHCGGFAPLLFWRHGAWRVFCFGFNRLQWFRGCGR